MKKCPFCAQENQDGMIVCQFCGRDLSAADVEKASEPNEFPDHSPGWSAYSIIGLIVGVLALVWLGTSWNAHASRPVLSKDPPFSFLQRLISVTPVSTPTPEPPCFGWYQITPEMRGQHVCVYGMVLDYREDWAWQRTYIYFGLKEEFYFVSEYRWSASIEDTCITAEGTVELNTHETPYVEVMDIYDCQ